MNKLVLLLVLALFVVAAWGSREPRNTRKAHKSWLSSNTNCQNQCETQGGYPCGS